MMYLCAQTCLLSLWCVAKGYKLNVLKQVVTVFQSVLFYDTNKYRPLSHKALIM